jgi:LacI family transcriptional regulator
VKRERSVKVSIRDIARAAGISNAAASYALQNKPEVSRATRDRVVRIARRMGYAPDARLSAWMARVRETKAKDFLPIAWLNAHPEKDTWTRCKWFSPYLEAARERCRQLGFRLEEIWLHQPGMTMRRVSQILEQQGIEGVIVTHYATHFRLNWDHLAGVSIEHVTLAPRLHRVNTDFFYNFLLAVKMLKRHRYERIGVCLEESLDRRTHQGIRAMNHYREAALAKGRRIPLFAYNGDPGEQGRLAQKRMGVWLRRYRPEVIVGHDNRLVDWVEAAGYRIPEDVGVVHLATDDDVSDWAGILSNKRTIGAVAVELLISLIQNRQYGVPKTAVYTAVQGTWHPGRTLLIPRS